MTLQRLKRIAALEARRRPPERPWFDPYDAAMALWVDLQAVVAGKAYWIPRPEPSEPWSEETAVAFERQMAEYDAMHRRLMAPEGR